MTTVLQISDTLTIPEDLARAAHLQAGSRVEVTSTPQGLLVRRSPLTHEEKVALLEGLRGEGRRLMPNAGSQVEALLRDRAEDDALDLEDELA